MPFKLTCGRHQKHVHEKQLSNFFQRLKYKKYKRKLCEGGDAARNKMSLELKISTVAELTESTLDIFITLAKNYCGYDGTTEDLIVKWVHPLFMKA